MQIVSNYLRLALFAALMLGFAATASAQEDTVSKAVTPSKDGSVTIDASRLTSITSLETAWRFAPGNDPKYADPGFDDSNWPMIQPGMSKLLADSHIPNTRDGQSWERLKIHVVNGYGPLALTISTRNYVPFEVFANGKRIAVAPNFIDGLGYVNRPIPVSLPRDKDIVLAVHCNDAVSKLHRFFPLQGVEIGQEESIVNGIDLVYLRYYMQGFLLEFEIGCVFFIYVVISLVLLFAQRSHKEYLWLAIFCLFAGLNNISRVAIYAGWVEYSNNKILVYNLTMLGATLALLELAAELAGDRRRIAVRLLQAYYILSNLPYVLGIPVKFLDSPVAQFLPEIAYIVLVAYELWSGYKKGRKECGLFLVPLTFYPLSQLFATLQFEYPQAFRGSWSGSVAGVGFNAWQVSSLPFLVGLIAVVLYRFIRVSKDEEIAASELEAAKSVQQLLIPAAQPDTPGFEVESAYFPARQVGGDFFLILPQSEVTGEQSLLAVVGDVSGKGLQAAMVVSTIIGGLRMGLVRQPAEVLRYLNQMLTGHVSGFATCCAVLIHHDGNMVIANAGNPSPYFGGKEIPTPPGLPLGIITGQEYEETTYLLEAGKRLTFVSDGVIEANKANSTELFGFERTMTISEESAASIADAARVFGAGGPQADDITVLTIKLA